MAKLTSNDLAPVVLFIFNRPIPTAQVYERIREARPKRFLVVADGPRSGKDGEFELCEATRSIVSTPDWPCELLTSFSPDNLGCRMRLSSGLAWVFQQCAEAIILEDDCLPAASFFSYCTSALEYYREDQRILHVSGDDFIGRARDERESYFFSRYPFSWGWASWKRAWKYYDVNMADWPSARQQEWLSGVLEDPLEVEYWTNLFDLTHRGVIDTWDYQWVFACWRAGGLCILPNRNLISNIGAGEDSIHYKTDHSSLGRPLRELTELTHPREIVRNVRADKYIWKNFFGKDVIHKHSFLAKVRRTVGLRTRLKSFFSARTK